MISAEQEESHNSPQTVLRYALPPLGLICPYEIDKFPVVGMGVMRGHLVGVIDHRVL